MGADLVFLDTVLLQQDMRVRLPKSLVVNMEGKPGRTRLDVYFDALTKSIVLKSRALEDVNEGEQNNG